MTFKPKIWFPVAVAAAALNLAGMGAAINAAEQLGHCLRTVSHLIEVEPVERDARDADEPLQVRAHTGQVLRHRGPQLRHASPHVPVPSPRPSPHRRGWPDPRPGRSAPHPTCARYRPPSRPAHRPFSLG